MTARVRLVAQRRPGFEPRRHFDFGLNFLVVSLIAQRRPGFEPRRHQWTPESNLPPGNAQRRPGFEPRRHPRTSGRSRRRRRTLNEGRGSNPGDTGRYLSLLSCANSLNEGRGSNPGDTPRTPRYHPRSCRALNEGRGSNPGDTWSGRRRRSESCRTLNEGRGSNPGDTRRVR